MPHSAQLLERAHHFGSGQAELGAIPAGGFPAARTAAGKLGPDTDRRAHAHALRILLDQRQLGVLLDHRNDLPPDLLGQHRHLDVFVVLESVADDRRVVIAQRHHGQQLRLGAGFHAELERLAELQNFFDHLPLLIHLDRVDAASSRRCTCARGWRLRRQSWISRSRCFRISAKRIRMGSEMPRSTSVSISFLRSIERAGSFSG